MVQVEAIAHLGNKLEPVIGLTLVLVLQAQTGEDAVLLKIVTGAQIELEGVVLVHVLISCTAAQHPVVLDEVAVVAAETEVELVRTVVADAEAGEEGVAVLRAFLKLGVGIHGSQHQKHCKKNFFHSVVLK